MMKHGPQLDPSTRQFTENDKGSVEKWMSSLRGGVDNRSALAKWLFPGSGPPRSELAGRYQDWLRAKGREALDME
jgi:hypothetical protein